jgi:hypothetical protein
VVPARALCSVYHMAGLLARKTCLLRIRVKDARAWIESTKLPRNQRIHEIRQSARRRSFVDGST